MFCLNALFFFQRIVYGHQHFKIELVFCFSFTRIAGIAMENVGNNRNCDERWWTNDDGTLDFWELQQTNNSLNYIYRIRHRSFKPIPSTTIRRLILIWMDMHYYKSFTHANIQYPQQMYAHIHCVHMSTFHARKSTHLIPGQLYNVILPSSTLLADCFVQQAIARPRHQLISNVHHRYLAS